MSALERYQQPQSLSEIERLAGHFASSGLFGNSPKTQGEIIVKMLAGAENGFPPFASVQGIHVIQGKPEMGADLLARSVKQSGRYDYRVRELTDSVCRIEFFEGDESIGESSFSLDDAKRAGLASGMYGKYPRNMLFARAMSNGVSWYCPDATSTRFYVDGEISQTPPDTMQNPDKTVIHEITIKPDEPFDVTVEPAERYQRTGETASAGQSEADKSRGSDPAFHNAKPLPVSTDSPDQTTGMSDHELTAAGVANGDENARHAPPVMGEPERVVADQLAAIGPDGRKRLKAHMRALDAVKGDQRKPETWVSSIIENWGEEWDPGAGPMYANLARVLEALDAVQRVDTPLERRDAEDAANDAEADALFQAQNGADVRTIPMYGQQAPS